jgi:hypothetical protein
MNVIFKRTGLRRYSVAVERPPHPDVEMNPAPGYDLSMPHDLMHMIVEAQLGLRHGIFGQLARGGTAGTFNMPIPSESASRTHGRVSRRVKAKGRKLLQEGRNDCEQSERATFICWREWLARSQATAKCSGTSADDRVKRSGVETPARKPEGLSEKKMNEICRHMDELSAAWSPLEVGEAIVISWPDLSLLIDRSKT